jgi:hypothetical protein
MGERRRPARHPVFRSRHLAQWSFRPWRVPVRAIGARSGWAAPENSVSGGLYRYDAKNLGGQQVVGAEGLAHVLGGWRVKRGDAEFKFFFGPEFQKHHLLPDGPSNRLRGNFLGLRMAFEVWYEPSPSSMVAADASLSSIATSNSARVAYGWRVFEEMLGGVYLGPVIEYFGSDGYRHLRLGAHLTSMKAEEIEWSAAAGWAQDSQGRASPYVRLNMLRRL